MLNKIRNHKKIFAIVILILIVVAIGFLILKSNLEDDYNEESEAKKQNYEIDIEKKFVDATKEYYCPDGFTLSGTTCNSVIETVAVKTYDCDEGVPIVTTGECSTYVDEYVNPIWYCSGTIPSMSESQISSYCTEKGYSRNLLGCPLGYSPDYQKNKCWKLAEKRVPAKVNYLCPDDYKVVGDKCKKTTSVTASYRLKCPNGYKLVGLRCIEN